VNSLWIALFCIVAGILETVSAFNVICTVGGGMMRGCSLQDPSVRLEERPGGLRTPNTWLSGLGAGQASPTSRTPGCSHIMLGLPALGA